MRIKSFFASIMPDKQKIQQHTYFRVIQATLLDQGLFHLSSRSVAGGISTGMFIAFLPVPGHTLLAILFSLVFRVNLPLSVLAAWTTNPLTIAPILYITYKTGAIVLGRPMQTLEFEMTFEWFGGSLIEIWPSLITGSIIFSIVTSATSYILIRILWRMAVINKWNKRNKRKSAT
ncbi:MAG: hypothetical protein ACI9XC_000109 [Gammaproteobacteria bacterium]|jgi:uncharacterized protein (DUF2062 family)